MLLEMSLRRLVLGLIPAECLLTGVSRRIASLCASSWRRALSLCIFLVVISRYLAKKMYMEALKLVSKLLLELKRLDDKIVLVQVHLLESKVYHELKNQPKAKVSY